MICTTNCGKLVIVKYVEWVICVKKYLGGAIAAFGALFLPLIIVVALAFGISMLWVEISMATVILFLICFFCVVSLIAFLKQIGIQLYTWGNFGTGCVKLKTLFTKPYVMEYDKCISCGIGYYFHGAYNSQVVGSKMYYIFLSYDSFDEKYRTRMNLWKPTKTRIKIKYSKKLYDYLITVLPEEQAWMLTCDYNKYKNKKAGKAG